MENSSFIELFEQVQHCPLCKRPSNESIVLYSVYHFKWKINILLCKNCGLTYKSHFPTQTLFEKIYGELYIHYQHDNITHQINELTDRVKRIGPPNGKLLDYGCGNGSFVIAALNNGWDAYGCDPFLPDKLANNELYKRCEKKDFSISGYDTKDKYNCITMWATAEHLINSESTFLNLFSQLSKNGIFIFNSPYGKSKIALKNGKNWRMSNIVEHLQFHTPQSVNYLATIGKMSVVNIRVCGSPYPFGSINSNEVDRTKDKNDKNSNEVVSIKNRRNIKEIIYKELIMKNKFKSKDAISCLINKFKIGDHLEVILKKK